MAKEITIEDEIAELQREIRMREMVYPDWSKGPAPKIKPDEAQRRIAVMTATLKRLQRLQEAKTGTQANLF